MKSIDDTLPFSQIEIQGMVRSTPVLMAPAPGATIVVPAGPLAERLRQGLRGSSIEGGLQSLAERADGTEFLTGCAPHFEAIMSLKAAGLMDYLCKEMAEWKVSEVAVHFVRKTHAVQN